MARQLAQPARPLTHLTIRSLKPNEPISKELGGCLSSNLRKTQLQRLSITSSYWSKSGLQHFLTPLGQRLRHLSLKAVHIDIGDDWQDMLLWLAERLTLDSVVIDALTTGVREVLRVTHMVMEGGSREARGSEEVVRLLRSLSRDIEWGDDEFPAHVSL